LTPARGCPSCRGCSGWRARASLPWMCSATGCCGWRRKSCGCLRRSHLTSTQQVCGSCAPASLGSTWQMGWRRSSVRRQHPLRVRRALSGLHLVYERAPGHQCASATAQTRRDGGLPRKLQRLTRTRAWWRPQRGRPKWTLGHRQPTLLWTRRKSGGWARGGMDAR